MPNFVKTTGKISTRVKFREGFLWNLASMKDLDDSRKKELESVCLILGPYRNLTTLLSLVLFLHPNCQVLNHAEERVLPSKKINFLSDYSSQKFDKFIQFALFASERGDKGDYGGSIAFTNAFGRGITRELFEDRYGKKLLKDTVSCIMWKGDLSVTNFIRDNKIDSDFSDIFSKNPLIKFIRPIRNPLDCAMSNYKTEHGRIFNNLKSFSPEDILTGIMEDLSWFVKLEHQYPERFFYFFEYEFNKDFLLKIANFLKIKPENRWIEDSLRIMKIKKASYEYPKNLVDKYKDLIHKYFKDYPALLNGLKSFIF